jgi:hypothetical protein
MTYNFGSQYRISRFQIEKLDCGHLCHGIVKFIVDDLITSCIRWVVFLVFAPRTVLLLTFNGASVFSFTENYAFAKPEVDVLPSAAVPLKFVGRS